MVNFYLFPRPLIDYYGMPDMPPSPGRDYMQSSYDNQKT